MHFLVFCFVFEYYTMQIWRFLYFSMLQTLFSEKPLIGQKKQLLMPNDGAKQLLRFLLLYYIYKERDYFTV